MPKVKSPLQTKRMTRSRSKAGKSVLKLIENEPPVHFDIPVGFSEECEAIAARRTTIDLLRDPSLISSGLSLLSKMQAKELKGQEIAERIGLTSVDLSEDDEPTGARGLDNQSQSLVSVTSKVGKKMTKLEALKEQQKENTEKLLAHKGEICFRELLKRTDAGRLGKGKSNFHNK